MSITQRGVVYKRAKGFYYLFADEGGHVECKVKGSLFKDSRYDNQIAVGDRVIFSIEEGKAVGLISQIEPRASFLSRSRVGIDSEQVIAANVDHLVAVASLKKPGFRPNLLWRLLVAAYSGSVDPVIVFSKTDLVDENTLAQAMKPFEGLGLTLVGFSINKDENKETLIKILKGKVCVLSGQSGVGKSSLLNHLFPDFKLKVGRVVHKTHKGAHTTTMAEMYPIDEDSFIIDTPGIKEFALWGIDKNNLKDHFPLISEYTGGCKLRNCIHVHEPNCKVQQDVKTQKIHPALYGGYLSIIESFDSGRS